jgi:hypothetical protein
MTETSFLTVAILALVVSIFWLAYRVGHQQPQSAISNFKIHNNQLQALLNTPDGRIEVLRFVVYEMALSNFIMGAQNDFEAQDGIAMSSDDKVFSSRADRIWDATKMGGKTVAKAAWKKLLNKANSLISGWSDKGSDAY